MPKAKKTDTDIKGFASMIRVRGELDYAINILKDGHAKVVKKEYDFVRKGGSIADCDKAMMDFKESKREALKAIKKLMGQEFKKALEEVHDQAEEDAQKDAEKEDDESDDSSSTFVDL